jgi:glutathione synthase/RimK-type ligase-like ATP-grasp enzyme
MKQIVLAILYSGNDWKKGIPFSDTAQRAAYEAFFTEAKEYSFLPIRVCVDWFQKGVFTRYWIFDGTWRKVAQPISPTIILDKSVSDYTTIAQKQRIAAETLFINPWEFDVLASDKLLTHIAFPTITPPTKLVRNRKDLRESLASIRSKELVLKPRLGHGGEGIHIVTHQQAKQMTIDSLTIVQPLIDTEKGIPGLYRGIHDLRVLFAGKQIVASYIRTPAPGTKLCNISRGGGVIEVPRKKLPKTLRPLLTQISTALSVFPYTLYSADFFYEKGKTPLLIELNTKPIIAFPKQYTDLQTGIHQIYLKYLASVI